MLSLTPLNLNEKELVSVFSLLPTCPSAARFADCFSVAPASWVIVRLVNRFAVGLWCSHLFLGAFIGWWCSFEIRSWRRHECAFCLHDILSSGLLCSALCFGRRVLCTSCPPRLHGYVLQHCVCVSFVLVRAWSLLLSRSCLRWCHVPVHPGDVSTASPSAIPVVTAYSSASAERGLKDHCVLWLSTQRDVSPRFVRSVLLQLSWSLAFPQILSVQACAVSERNCSSIILSAFRTAFSGWRTLRFTFISSLSVWFKYHRC